VQRRFLKLVCTAYVNNINTAFRTYGIDPSELIPDIHVLPPTDADDSSSIGCVLWYKYRVNGEQDEDKFLWALGKLDAIDYTVSPPSYQVTYLRDGTEHVAETERSRIVPAGFPRGIFEAWRCELHLERKSLLT